MNDMTVVRLWLAGRLHTDPVWLPMSTRTAMREGAGPDSRLHLDSRLAACLAQSVALNTTASLQRHSQTSAASLIDLLHHMSCLMWPWLLRCCV